MEVGRNPGKQAGSGRIFRSRAGPPGHYPGEGILWPKHSQEGAMPTTPLRSVLQAALSGTGHGILLRTDAELLAAFAAARDEAAFAELVRRHGPLVRGTARRLAGSSDAADDVFQATFLLLARKTSAASWGPTVGPWLYQAARRLGIKARSRAAHRQSFAPLDSDVAAPATDPSAGLAWAEVRDALDHALAALPARLRDPLVLCYLEGMTQDEAAMALGCSSATVKGRVTRGRERMRRLLARRGLFLSAALAVPLVAEPAVAANVVTATARAAVAFRATGVTTPAVGALLQGTLPLWKLTAGLVGLVLACTAGAVGLFVPCPTTDPAEQDVATSHVDARDPGEPATDILGDPLPAGAVARLGTRRLCGPLDDPRWVGFSPDGTKIASRISNAVTVWDAATGRLLVERKNYFAWEGAVGWRADGTGVALVLLPDWSYFVSAFTDPTEKLPNPPPASGPPGNPNATAGDLDLISLAPDATRVAIVRDRHAKQFHIDLFPATPGQELTADGKTLATFTGEVVTLWEWPIGKAGVTISVPVRTDQPTTPKQEQEVMSINSVALSPDGRLLFTYARENGQEATHDVWNARTGKHLQRLVAPRTDYCVAAFSANGRMLYTGGRGVDRPDEVRKLTAWDPTAGTLIRQFADPYPKPVENSPDAQMKLQLMPATRSVEAVAVSPDGRLLAVAEFGFIQDRSPDYSVWIYETVTGGLIRKLPGHSRWINDLAFAPDGRRLVSVGHDQTGLVWDVTLPTLGGKTADMRLTKARDQLVSLDPATAYAGMAALAASPGEAVPLLRAKLQPAPVPTDADLDRLVKQLDAESFDEREKAMAELERFGPNALAGVKARLERKPSLELRNRLTRFLDKYSGPNPYQLRCVRGVATLEAVGTADAKAFLAELARGPADDVLTREAQATSRRLGAERAR
jgi:RNA polymerase sigma factor (sigma-70 family)